MAEKIAWGRVLAAGIPLAAEDRRLVQWLAEGKNQVEIAKVLGVKRWRVWRQVKEIKARRSQSVDATP